MRRSIHLGGLRRRTSFLLVLLLAVMLLPASGAGAQDPPTAPEPSETCPPDHLPTDAVTAGMTGTGWTVARGTEPEPFAVEVLGVMRNAILPGHDLIVVDTSGAIIDAAGGIWYGMSGSPVYVEDAGEQKLIGALAWGFSFGPSSIAGLTPAAEMVELLDGSADDAPALAEADTARLDTQMRRTIAQHDGVAVTQVSTSMERLPVPVSVTSSPRRSLARVQDSLERFGLSPLPFAGGTAAATEASDEPLHPGDNFAAALSYGDLTWAGIGTTTIVCAGEAVAFGHPFFFTGDIVLGANHADALTIVDDPVFGPYKLANVAGGVGTVDQDRFAGIHTALGDLPELGAITSSTSALDTARHRDGRTDVAFREAMPDLAFFHALLNIDSVFDQVGRGSSTLTMTASGTRRGGEPWELTRSDRFASDWDIAIESVWEMLFDLLAIQYNRYEPVEITDVDLDIAVDKTVRRLAISEVLVSLDGEEFGPPTELFVAPGDTIDVRVTLTGFQSGEQVVADLALEVPADAAGFGDLVVRGGAGFEEDPSDCFFFPEECQLDADGFDGVLEAIASRARNDELVAHLTVWPDAFGEVEPFNGDGGPGGVTTEVREQLEEVVSGSRLIPVFVFPEGVEASIERIGGRDRIETALLVSQRHFPDGADTVVVARADEYADALAGGPLAATMDAPVLLTGRSGLRHDVAEEVARLGADRAVLLGGAQALPDGIAADLAAAGVGDVDRIGGSNRYDTARLIALEIGGDEVFVTQGHHRDPRRGWPDAVAVSGLAASLGHPILLVEEDRLPAETAAALDALDASQATIVGGTAAVSAPVAAAIGGHVASVGRIAGANRYETSVAVAEHAVELGADPLTVFLATGRNHPDALAAAPAVAARGGVLLLIDGQGIDGSPASAEWLSWLAGAPVDLTLLGGPAAITEETAGEVVMLLIDWWEEEPF